MDQSFDEFNKHLENSEKLSFLDKLAAYFSLTNEELINVLTIMMREKKHIINDLQFNENKTNIIARISPNPEGHHLKFGQLSGGEKQRVLLEIVLRIATYYSRFTSTILMIEYTSFDIIDSAGINHLFDVIRNEDMNFQFFFTSKLGSNFNTQAFTTWLLEPSKYGNIVAKKVDY